jgi:hypothetical protein
MAAAVIRTGPLFRRVFNKVEQRAGLRMSGRAVAAVLQREAGHGGVTQTNWPPTNPGRLEGRILPNLSRAAPKK